jgi:hypothetical protein
MISGSTTLIAHIGYPTETFKAPLIYNPYFEKARIDAVVVPMGVKAGDYRDFLKSIFRLTNIRGALITMPHKVTTVGLLDECSTAVSLFLPLPVSHLTNDNASAPHGCGCGPRTGDGRRFWVDCHCG